MSVMDILKQVAAEVIGMFVDDGRLAIAILVVVAVAAWVAARFEPSLYCGLVLFIGCVAVLVANVVQATRRG